MPELSVRMSEPDFIEAIDATLASRPAHEIQEAITIAAGISTNALLMVVYELASTARREFAEYLAQVRAVSDHRVVLLATDLAAGFLQQSAAEATRTDELLAVLQSSGNLYNGLALVELVDPSKQQECEVIRDRWSRQHRAAPS